MGDSVKTKYCMALTTSNGFAYTYNLVITIRHCYNGVFFIYYSEDLDYNM